MATENAYSEKLIFAKTCGDINERIKTNLKTEVECEGIKRVVSVLPEIRLTKKEITETSINVTGALTLYICYINAEGEIKKYECGSNLEHTISLAEKCDRVNLEATVERIETDTSGINLFFSLAIRLKGKTERTESVLALKGGEGLIVKHKEITCSKKLEEVEGLLALSEEKELNYSVGEVIMQRANAVVTSATSGVGLIIVDGVAYFSAILLQSGEKKDIIKERKAIPFRFEIECEEAMPNDVAVAFANVKSLKTDLSVDTEKDISLIKIELALKLQAECYKSQNCVVATDLFSVTNQVSLKRFSFDTIDGQELRSITKNFSSSMRVLEEDGEVVCLMPEQAEVLTYSFSEKGVTATGTFGCLVVYKNQDGEPVCKKAEFPFEETLELEGDYSDCGLSVVINDLAKEKVNSEQIEIKGEITFNLTPKKSRQINVIAEALIGEEKEKSKYPLSVYIAKPGEDEWELAKRLNTSPEKLLEINKELVFPLTGEERIVVYRQKT